MFFTSYICFSQSNKPTEDRVLYEKGIAITEIIYNDEVYELIENPKNESEEKIATKFVKMISNQALEYFDKLINEFPDSELFTVTLYEKSLLELIQENNKKAKESLLAILNKESSKKNYHRNKSLIELAKLYIQENNFKQAMIYLEERTENGFYFQCGVELNTTLKQLDNLKAICNEGLNEKK